MKLVWGKLSNSLAMAVMPRAELTPEEVAEGKGNVFVDLSRAKSGGCIYPLHSLHAHDYHAPRWAVDGSAPSNSTNPTLTAQGYMDRVKADVEAQGVQVTEVEVREIAAPEPTASAAPSPYEGEEPGEVNWPKYGVDAPKKDDEEVN